MSVSGGSGVMMSSVLDVKQVNEVFGNRTVSVIRKTPAGI